MGDRGRRDSITNATDQFQIMLEQEFIKLRKIWDRVGLQEEERKERMNIALSRFLDVINAVLNEEKEMEAVLIRRLQDYSNELLEYCTELGLEMPSPDSKWSLMETEAHVIAALKDVKQQRCARMAELQDLMARDANVSDRLDVVRFAVSEEVVPSSATLDALRKHLEAATNEFEKRYADYSNTKKEMQRMWKAIGRAPRTTVERQIAQLNDDELVLSERNMDALETELRSVDFECKDHMRPLREKVVQLWDKCCFNQDERNLFEAFFAETITEEVFAAHREEIHHLTRYYEENKENLSQVNQWEDLFAKLKDFEAPGNDSDRLKNRGGALLREERERLDIERRFPKFTDMLMKASASWGSFKVYGLSVPDYIEDCLERHRNEKEAERLLKLKQKQEQLEVERKFGAKPVAPVKSLRIRPPTKTPTAFHQESSFFTETNASCNETFISQSGSSTGVRSNNRQFIHSSIANAPSRSPFTSVGNKTPTMTSANGRGNNFSTCLKRPAPSSVAELAGWSEPRRPRLIDLDDTLRPTTVTGSPSKHTLPTNLVNANASIISSNLSYDHFAMALHNSDAADNKHSSILLAPSTANKRRK